MSIFRMDGRQMAKLVVTSFAAAATMFLFLAVPSLAAEPHSVTGNPDFTQGDKIPEGANHDWNLGATGARGWMFSDKMVTTDARQIYDHRGGAEFAGRRNPRGRRRDPGRRLANRSPTTRAPSWARRSRAAESQAGGGNLSLIRWRAGKTENVVVKLPVLGTYSATAPYDCPKSQRILEQGCKALAERIADPSYRAERDHPLA